MLRKHLLTEPITRLRGQFKRIHLTAHRGLRRHDEHTLCPQLFQLPAGKDYIFMLEQRAAHPVKRRKKGRQPHGCARRKADGRLKGDNRAAFLGISACGKDHGVAVSRHPADKHPRFFTHGQGAFPRLHAEQPLKMQTA